MKTKIAKVKLAPGSRVFFDPLTGINLNQECKTAFIYDDADLSNIRAALQSNRIQLAEGRLPSAKVSTKPIPAKGVKIDEIAKPIVKKVAKVKQEVKEVKEDIVVEESKQEVIAVEEVVIKKATRKKKKSTDELDTEE